LLFTPGFVKSTVGIGAFKDDENASLFLDKSHGTGLNVLSVSQDSVIIGEYCPN
jgi:hypothetical protein